MSPHILDFSFGLGVAFHPLVARLKHSINDLRLLLIFSNPMSESIRLPLVARIASFDRWAAAARGARNPERVPGLIAALRKATDGLECFWKHLL